MRSVLLGVFFLGSLGLVACSSSSRDGFDEGSQQPGPDPGTPPAPAPTGDFDKNKPPPGKPVEIAEVFGHSADTLYRLDPDKKDVTTVGKFNGCKAVLDIALDGSSNI